MKLDHRHKKEALGAFSVIVKLRKGLIPALPEDIVLCEPGLAPGAAPVVHNLLQHGLVHLHRAVWRELGNYRRAQST